MTKYIDDQVGKIDAQSGSRLLFKYLDIKGAESMIANNNLQFTNATKFNDPFDCHPGLIDFSKISPKQANPWGVEDTILLKSDRFRRNREEAWICCLSKIHDSILMWSYYTKHKGVCIGLDIEKVKKHLCPELGFRVYNSCYEVKYRDIIEKPDYFACKKDLFNYQMLTKAKDWSHEQEVRMFKIKPSFIFMNMCLPYVPQDKDEGMDWKEVCAYLNIDVDCFNSIYLGVNIEKNYKKRIIEIARENNPDIKIYQMKANPHAFKLDSIVVD